MSETLVCPECGDRLSPDAPRGICPRCLMNTALAATATGAMSGDPASDERRPASTIVHEREMIVAGQLGGDVRSRPAGAGWTQPDRDQPAIVLSLAEFKRVVIDLGIIDAEAIDMLAGGISSGTSGLARSLIQSGVLTAYQACAIQQGKARGLLVGRYLILDKLGAGGMGVVFKARHHRLGRVVALKILPPSFARNRNLVLRFRREAQAAARLDHPNIVSVFDADEDRGVYFLAMDYIDGHDLDCWIRDHGPFQVGQALDCVIQAARGLEAAHAQGIVHRDIKPGNLMLDQSGIVRVLDLGLARLVNPSSPFGQTTGANLTQSGVYMGTVDFMAPEQAEDSSKVDHRADIYSLGCSLYFLLTGHPPFEGATLLSRIIAHQQQSPPSLRATCSGVSEPLDAAYLAMMAKRPDDRPRSMTDVIALLESCRAAAQAGDLPFTLESFSKSVPENGARRRDDGEPTIFIARDESGGFQFETDLNTERLDVGPDPCEPTPKLDAARSLKRVWSTFFPRNAGRRPASLAALGSLVALAALTFIVALSRPGGETRSTSDPLLKSSPPPQDTTPVPTATVILDTADSQPEMVPDPSHEMAALEPKPTPEPTLPKTTRDLSRPVTRKVPDRLKHEVAKVPTYDVAPVFTKHTGPLTAIAVTGNGRFALSASQDHTARLWEVRTGKEIVAPLTHPSDVLAAAITPDGRFALTATKGLPNRNGLLRLWNLATGKAVFDRMGIHHVGPIRAVAFLPNNRGLSGGQDGRVNVWNLERGRWIGTLGSQQGFIHGHAMAVFPDGRRALSGGQDGLVHVWNLVTGKESVHWRGHDGLISDVAISYDGHRAVTGSDDHTVILWDVATGSQVHSFPMPDGDNTPSVAILPDGNVVAAGGVFGQLVLWDVHSGAILRRAQPPLVSHADLAVMPDGRQVLTADHDGVVRLWTPRRGER